MKLNKYIIILAIVALSILSCTKESIKDEWARQETNIEKFIEAQKKANPGIYVAANNGSERVVAVKGQGDSLKAGGTVSFYYAGYIFNSPSISTSNLFATNKEDIAKSAGWELSEKDALKIETINLNETALVEGLKNGLCGVKGGEECIILFSGKYGFGTDNLGTIPANSALAYHIWVESISNE